MRSTTAACCAVAVAALLTTSACGGTTHHARTATRARARTKATGAVTGADGTAKKALLEAAALADTKKSAEITAVVDLYGKRATTKGSYTWGSGGPRSDTMVDPAALGIQKLSHTKLVEARQIGTASYYHVDPQPKGPLKGKHWMKIDLSAYLGTEAANADAGSGVKANPADTLRKLAASTDLRTVGTETVDGRSTTHYSGHVPASAAMKKQGLVEPPLVDVWLASDGTLIRCRQDVSSVVTTEDFTSFGGPKTIAAPPASDTADMTAAVRAQRQKALHPSS